VLVGHVVRLLQHRGAPVAGVGHAPVDVRHFQRDVGNAVAVPAVVVGHRAARADRAPEHEPDRAAAQHERVVVPVAGLRAGIGHQLHAERELEVQGGLGGVPHGPDHGVPASDRERVALGVVGNQPDQLPELVHVELGELFLDGQYLVDGHGAGLSWGVQGG
jgi:hypothetical protein